MAIDDLRFSIPATLPRVFEDDDYSQIETMGALNAKLNEVIDTVNALSAIVAALKTVEQVFAGSETVTELTLEDFILFDTAIKKLSWPSLKTAISDYTDTLYQALDAAMAFFKSGTGTFTDNDTSQTFADTFCTDTALVVIAITSVTEPQGIWTVDSSAGSFTITSDTAESADIAFDYYIMKKG